MFDVFLIEETLEIGKKMFLSIKISAQAFKLFSMQII
jgi:hypothetical protein